MNLYRLLYGTGPDGTYGMLSEDPELRRFLLRDIGADNPHSIVERTMGVFGAFRALADYGRYSGSELPVMIRYAPMHMRVFPGMPVNIRPFCVVGVSGNEGLSRDTTYTQMDYFSMAQLKNDEKYSYLDYLLGIREFSRQDVDSIRSGKQKIPAPVPRKIIPVMRSSDKEHVLKAVCALFQQKLVVIQLENGASFVSRAREILAQIYSLLPVSYAAEVGYSIYQSPDTILDVTRYWSIRIFVVPAEERVELNNPDIQVINMAFSEWNSSSRLLSELKQWWDMPWERRLTIMTNMPAVINQEDFLSYSSDYLNAAKSLDFWCEHPLYNSVGTLADLKKIFDGHPEWKLLPWAKESVTACLPNVMKQDLTVDQLNARAYANLYSQEQPDSETAELLEFGMQFGSIDQKTLCDAVDEHANIRAEKRVEKELSELRYEKNTLAGQLQERQAKLTETSDKLNETVTELRTEKSWNARNQRNLEDIYALVEPPAQGNAVSASWQGLKTHVSELLADRESLKQSNDYLHNLQIDPKSPDAAGKVTALNQCKAELDRAQGYLNEVGIYDLETELAAKRIDQIRADEQLLRDCRGQFTEAGIHIEDLRESIAGLLMIEQALANQNIQTISAETVTSDLMKLHQENEAAKDRVREQEQDLGQICEVLHLPEDRRDVKTVKDRIRAYQTQLTALSGIRDALEMGRDTTANAVKQRVIDLKDEKQKTEIKLKQVEDDLKEQEQQLIGNQTALEGKERMLQAQETLRTKETELLKQWKEAGAFPETWEADWDALKEAVVPEQTPAPKTNTPAETEEEAIGGNLAANIWSNILGRTKKWWKRGGKAAVGKLILPMLILLAAFVIGGCLLNSCGEDPDPTESTGQVTESKETPDEENQGNPDEENQRKPDEENQGNPDEENQGKPDEENQENPDEEHLENPGEEKIQVDPALDYSRKDEFKDWGTKPYDKMRDALSIGDVLKFEQDHCVDFFADQDCGLVAEVAFCNNGDKVSKEQPYAVLLSPAEAGGSFSLPTDADAVICCGSNVIAVYGDDQMTCLAIRFMGAMLAEEEKEHAPVRLTCFKKDDGSWIDYGSKFGEITADPSWMCKVTDWSTDVTKCQDLQKEYELPAVPMLAVRSDNWIIMVIEGGHDTASVNKTVVGQMLDHEGQIILIKPLSAAQ